MMARQASLLVADEIFYNLYGKAILHGVYHGDLTIAADPSLSSQLIFYFMAEADVSDPFRSLTVEVSLPSGEPIRNDVAIIPPEILKTVSPNRNRISYRHPMLIQMPLLKPGKIEAKVIHEAGEIVVTAPWIVLAATSTTPPKLS